MTRRQRGDWELFGVAMAPMVLVDVIVLVTVMMRGVA